VIDATTGATLEFVVTYGAAALLAVFVLEGMLVGKLLPTRTLFVGVVLAAGTGLVELAPVLVAAAVGATVGQTLLFLSIRHLDVDPVASDRLPVERRHVDRSERWFDRWGPAAIALTNVLPVARGWMTVPTAMTEVSGYRFSLYSMAGTAVYVGLLVGVAAGLETAIDAVV